MEPGALKRRRGGCTRRQAAGRLPDHIEEASGQQTGQPAAPGSTPDNSSRTGSGSRVPADTDGPSGSIYARTRRTIRSNELGMRPMQERAWEKHGEGNSEDWLRRCAGRSSRHPCAPCYALRCRTGSWCGERDRDSRRRCWSSWLCWCRCCCRSALMWPSCAAICTPSRARSPHRGGAYRPVAPAEWRPGSAGCRHFMEGCRTGFLSGLGANFR